MSMTLLQEEGKKLQAIRAELKTLFDKKKDGKFDWSEEDHAKFIDLDGKATAGHDEFKKLEKIVNAETTNAAEMDYLNKPIGQNPMGFGGHGNEITVRQKKSVGELFGTSAEYKTFLAGGCNGIVQVRIPDSWVGDLDYKTGRTAGPEFKTTMSNTAGFAPFIMRTGDIVPFALRRPVVQDLMPSIRVDGPALKYMEETTFSQVATGVSEAGTKPETARAYTERTVLVEVVACVLPVTEQQLADVPQIMGLINASMGTEIALSEENLIVNGTGTSPQLQGFLTKTGVQTAAAGSSPLETALFNSFTQIRFTGFAEPSAVVINPIDWQTIVVHQMTTGAYIYGSPNDAVQHRMWGVPTVVTPVIAQGTALSGDFASYAYVARRMDLRIDVGWINDNFVKNIRTLRAESRLALVIRRPTAFATVTGITSAN